MAAVGMGMVAGSVGSACSAYRGRSRGRSERRGGVRCAVAGSLVDQYRTLKIQPGASEKEVKQAFRKLALQYHPDVCKGSNCGVQFHRINEAYDIVMSSLRNSEEEEQRLSEWSDDGYCDESMRGMYDSSWDLWEEWMGWEGAGIRDYTSHINPYI
ncbi:hypothetical protein J5N97_008194 [Dioscorea zingiberensis]|uniref:J domain-containing protein n=1 Tax=Dioscorea zingiberensis TaxID=325984 RepID=A0A9D5HVI5_9LILI|nr:hypothetical protein J5N97_008194 [Dioscorea zingiberensis]